MIRHAVVTALVAVLAPLGSTLAQQHVKVIDSLMSAYAAPGAPGASVLVIHRGRTALMKSYGLADVDRGVAVTPVTNFRLASLSKQFTATAVMLLVAQHKLRYDDGITTLLPDLPAFAHGVTVRHLLNHTSGLPDYEDFVPNAQTRQVHDAEIPALIAHAPAGRFAPGSQYAYSNTGYGLLALIVERVSRKRYARFLHDRIFVPLHMNGTVAFEEGVSVVQHRAYGHSVRGEQVRLTDQSNTSAMLGDGGIYSSVADLAKWDSAIERHTLVSAGAQQLAFTPPVLPAGAKTEYGFGWFADHETGSLRLRHHGESRGFTNGIVRYPDKRLTVIVLTNRTGGAPWDIAQRIAELYLGTPASRASAPWRP